MVESSAQAGALLEPFTQHLLDRLMDQPAGAQQLAGALGVPLHRVIYRLKQLLGLGLVRVESRRPRPGRAIAVYAPVAQSYAIPFALTPAATLREFFVGDMRSWLEPKLDRVALNVHDPVTLVFARHGEGAAYLDYQLSAADEHRLRRTRFLSRSLELTEAQLNALEAAVRALLDQPPGPHNSESHRLSVNLLVFPEER